jgi:hypothetical protein
MKDFSFVSVLISSPKKNLLHRLEGESGAGKRQQKPKQPMNKQLTLKKIAVAAFCGLVVLAGCSTQQSASAKYKLGDPITVFGFPVLSGGTQGTCPGAYAGYVIYTKSLPAWGWVPLTNTTVFTASDGGGRTNTKIVYDGHSLDSGCAQTTVTIPNPPPSPKYRFAIYFPNNVPTTNYPIILTGFGP